MSVSAHADGKRAPRSRSKLPNPWYQRDRGRIRLFQGDCLELIPLLAEQEPLHVIFADPPYFLSNGGVTCQAGKMVKVDKGRWDVSKGAEANHQFNLAWLEACQKALAPNGTVWVSGTSHVIHSVGFAMQQLGFKLLNDITWEKPNPPPNLSCRYFTHATETVIWAGRDKRAKHTFHYKDMKRINGGKQMKSVWRFTAPPKREKEHGRHPTQKPEALLERVLLASAAKNALVLDPFNGSGTTGVVCARLGLRYVGIELETEYLELTRRRLEAG